MTVQVFVGRASFERTFRRSERIDVMGHVLSLVLGYRESSVVGPVCDRDRQGFQQMLFSFVRLFPRGWLAYWMLSGVGSLW